MKACSSKVLVASCLVPVTWLPAFAKATVYKVDPQHSFAQFGVTHLMISKVRGEFHALNGTVNVDESDVTKSSVEVTIDASTIDTREPDRDQNLKSPQFLDVTKYPTMSFRSTKVEKGSSGHLKITGDLTIHGVTKSVVYDRAEVSDQGSVGIATDCGIRNHKNQPSGFRSYVQRNTRQWGSRGRERSRDHAGRGDDCASRKMTAFCLTLVRPVRFL